MVENVSTVAGQGKHLEAQALTGSFAAAKKILSKYSQLSAHCSDRDVESFFFFWSHSVTAAIPTVVVFNGRNDLSSIP